MDAHRSGLRAGTRTSRSAEGESERVNDILSGEFHPTTYLQSQHFLSLDGQSELLVVHRRLLPVRRKRSIVEIRKDILVLENVRGHFESDEWN